MTRWEQYCKEYCNCDAFNDNPRRGMICSSRYSCDGCFLEKVCDSVKAKVLWQRNPAEFERRINEWLDEEVDE